MAEQVTKGRLELKGNQLITGTVSKGFWAPKTQIAPVQLRPRNNPLRTASLFQLHLYYKRRDRKPDLSSLLYSSTDKIRVRGLFIEQ